MDKGGIQRIWTISLILILLFNTFSPIFTIGFLASEMAGDFVFGVGVAVERPFAGAFAGLGADVFVGNFWEWIFYGE